jgi:diketogulonate reductase-like aldo/keto reductase
LESQILSLVIEELLKVAKIKPVLNQFELHPLYYEVETIEYCKKHDILIEAYSSFARFEKGLIENEVIC